MELSLDGVQGVHSCENNDDNENGENTENGGNTEGGNEGNNSYSNSTALYVTFNMVDHENGEDYLDGSILIPASSYIDGRWISDEISDITFEPIQVSVYSKNENYWYIDINSTNMNNSFYLSGSSGVDNSANNNLPIDGTTFGIDNGSITILTVPESDIEEAVFRCTSTTGDDCSDDLAGDYRLLTEAEVDSMTVIDSNGNTYNLENFPDNVTYGNAWTNGKAIITRSYYDENYPEFIAASIINQTDQYAYSYGVFYESGPNTLPCDVNPISWDIWKPSFIPLSPKYIKRKSYISTKDFNEHPEKYVIVVNGLGGDNIEMDSDNCAYIYNEDKNYWYANDSATHIKGGNGSWSGYHSYTINENGEDKDVSQMIFTLIAKLPRGTAEVMKDSEYGKRGGAAPTLSLRLRRNSDD